ncbi:hypothetical protein, partial [Methylobacterium sp. E-046]|uniref:hypothetical protein n=1 Tax=Methylobacterium sp. E-046 TaxID=2836576 RepID=UPI001FBA20F2
DADAEHEATQLGQQTGGEFVVRVGLGHAFRRLRLGFFGIVLASTFRISRRIRSAAMGSSVSSATSTSISMILRA